MKKTASGYRLIFGYLGLFIIFVGLATFLPLFALFAYPEEACDWYCFVIPGGGAIILGLLLFLLIARRTKAQLGKHQDAILLVLVWVCAILISAIPFLIKGNLNFVDSIFETTSAYATIGLSVFKPEDFDLHLFVLYRSILCFVGGIGLVLIVTSAISDRYGLKLYVAEGHNDKLMPNLARSARLMLSIYTGITAFGVLLYSLAGMPVFDSIIHSISAVATGGFSSKDAGFMYFSNYPNFWLMECISILLMILGATNFLIHLFWLTGRFKKVWKDCEVRLFLALLFFFIPFFFISAIVGRTDGGSIGKSFTQGAFTYISAITTTGFTNIENVTSLGQGVIYLVVLVNIIGGGMGSTAGGIKQYRLAVALKSFFWSTRENASSSNIIYPHYIYRFGEEKEIKENDVASAFSYILLYVMLMFLGGLLITIFYKNPAYTFGDSLFEFSNALSSTGMSNGLCKVANDGAKWVLIAGMFAGRLEILGIYFAFYRVFRDIFRKETI